jgi:hypothetical protein
MPTVHFSLAQRRYNRRIFWLSMAYAGLLALSILLFRQGLVAGPLAYLVGLLPALAVSGFFWTMGRYLVEEADEYLRMLQIRQLLIATGIALTAETMWGFLEGFGLLPHVLSWIWALVWVAGLVLGAGANFVLERRHA